jgi:hypothetical protein
MKLEQGTIIKVQDETIGQTIIDEVFSDEESNRFKKNHPIGEEADAFLARDPGDSLVFIKNGLYKFWDSQTGNISILGNETSEFILGHEE